MPTARELIREFDAKHGPGISDGTMRYYRDGSTREMDPMGALNGVECFDLSKAEEEFTIRENQLRYHKILLERAVAAFDLLNSNLAATASIAEGDLAELRRLRRIVQARRALVSQAEEALAQTQKGQQLRRVREGQQLEKTRLAEFQARRRAIRI